MLDSRGGGGSCEFRGAKSIPLVAALAPITGAPTPPGVRTVSSASEFQAPQPSQRPDHLAWAVPHDWQTNAVFDLAIDALSLQGVILTPVRPSCPKSDH